MSSPPLRPTFSENKGRFSGIDEAYKNSSLLQFYPLSAAK